MSKKMQEINRVIDENIERVLSTGFARYSKYIIQERALPDVRDGLKPVQRRILYAMYKEKNTSDKNYRKSAKTVGNVIGNYHPHGDSSVYDAMVRLSQDWKMREILVDVHGNNGSMDNDPPAAMRYTEARLSKIAEELLRDIDQYTVEFTPNFDDTEVEPTVLPSRFPNILVNGSQGISAGYATDIPPHNLEEVINAVVYRLKHPFSPLEKIMQYIKGPDFPTGGIVQGLDGIKDAYTKGKGKIVVRCKYEFDEKHHQIIISNIPYEVNKANLMKKLEDIRIDKVLDGYEEARDESDKHGLRIVIDCKADANKELIINYLLKNTDLKINYNFNMVVIHNKHPKQAGLLDILDAYIEHQKEIVTNRSNYELAKSKKRLHILEGLIIMVSIIDQVIKVIRQSKNKSDAKNNIIEQFNFTEEQAEAIVTLQLYRLSSTDVATLEEEARILTKRIQELIEILNNEQKLIDVIIKEIEEIKKKYKNPRKTEIQQEIEEIQIDQADMIKSEDVILTITKEGYLRSLRKKGDEVIIEKANNLTPKDYVIANLLVNTLDDILLFTNKGNYILLHTHQIEIGKVNDFHHINDYVKIEPDEYFISVIPAKSLPEDLYVVMATKLGYIKRTALSEFNVSRNNKTYTAISLKDEHDACVSVMLADDCEREVCVITEQGYINKYTEDQISILKLKASGVKSINLKEDDTVVSMVYLGNDKKKIVLITQRGNIKTIDPSEISFSVRTNRGMLTLKSLKRNNHTYIGAVYLDHEQAFVVESEEGSKVLISDTQSLSEIVSNGKSHSELDAADHLKRVVEVLTNASYTLPQKDKKKTKKSANSQKFEQIDLFKVENLTE
jgi:topoisomerase IV subunit A